MTSRCNAENCKSKIAPKRINIPGIALLLIICAVGSSSVSAQDDGATIPAPPQIKRTTDTTADPEFKSPPMRRELRRARRQQSFNNNDMVPSGDGPNFPGPDGPPGGRFAGGRGFGPEGGMPPRFAGRRGPGGPGGPGGGFGGHRLDLTPLNLTEDQKQKIKQLRQTNRERMKDIRQSLITKQQSLRTLLFSPDATDSQIRSARKEVRKIQDQMEDIMLDDMLGIRSVLTPDQKAKLPSLAPNGPRTAARADRQ